MAALGPQAPVLMGQQTMVLLGPQAQVLKGSGPTMGVAPLVTLPVSYTHLTLPTICSV